ncbi:tRNA (adenine(22)-N(1))-methyltransferase [Halonatronum saccharophilum]|uniref:tRNA (adenine(22)-N(1))-methyltransferase n=1 Tax=Halonatronum saccharophilum TaxID=150060 RepID=UPI00048396AC|nr:class I SAM-dependent methyltransferase [Halonatronum saccharophilum]
MKLSPRLKSIVDLLDLPARVGDIGADHGYLAIHLARQDKDNYIIASDYNKAPYKAALNNVRRFALSDRIDVRLGSGLSVLNEGEVDQVVIAGMGSKTIKSILEDDQSLALKLDKLVLQPMAGASSLRRWLVKNGYKISDEKLILEGDFLYQIIAAKPGEMDDEGEFILELGPKLLEKKDPLLELYFKSLEDEWSEVIEKISMNAPNHPKIDIINKKLNKLKGLKRRIT